MSLRPYQQKAVQQVLDCFITHTKVMLQMPTGTGKTEVFSEVINRFISSITPAKRVLVLVHTRELVGQIHRRLYQRCGIRSGLILAGHESRPELQVQVASIQTLIRRDEWPKNISLVVVDEAHHATAESYRNVIKHYVPLGAKLLGVTATPQRLDGTGFQDLFERLVVSDNVKTFISDKWLSEVKHFAVSSLDLSGIPIRNGDYELATLGSYMTNPKRIADVTESYIKYGQAKKAIVFTVNQLHNQLVSQRFNELNIRSASIDSNTPKDKRDIIIKDFEKGVFKVLCNVQIFTEGFDCPDVGLVILARPTKSLTLYLQMIGRVMRPAPDKPYAIVLDNAMLWKEHKLVTTERVWSLRGCKTSKAVDVEIMNGGAEVKEVPNELQRRKFEEITDDDIEVHLRKTRLKTIAEGDSIRVAVKQDRKGANETVHEVRVVAEKECNVNKFTGALSQDLCREINFHLVNKSSLLLRNRTMHFDVWFNGIKVTQLPQNWKGVVPGKALNGADQQKIGRLIFDSLRLVEMRPNSSSDNSLQLIE